MNLRILVGGTRHPGTAVEAPDAVEKLAHIDSFPVRGRPVRRWTAKKKNKKTKKEYRRVYFPTGH